MYLVLLHCNPINDADGGADGGDGGNADGARNADDVQTADDPDGDPPGDPDGDGNGIEVPMSIEQAYALDKANGNTMWQDAIDKEMKQVLPLYTLAEIKAHEKPAGFQQVRCHLVFNVKMNGDRKARFVTEDFDGRPLTFASFTQFLIDEEQEWICQIADHCSVSQVVSSNFL